MKYWPCFLIIACACMQSVAQKVDCLKNHRTGKYTYQSRGQMVEIVRTENEQTEIFNDGKSKLILSVEWLNNSTYLLTLKQAVNSSKGCLSVGDWIKVTIVKCYGKQYSAKYESNKCGAGESVFVKVE